MIRFMNAFVKLTGWPAQLIVFRTKYYYEDKSVQSRRIKGPAIIVSNHTAVYDYACMLFVFFTRTLRYQMAELLFEKKLLGPFLKLLGGIYINRNATDLGFMSESESILKKGGVVGIFPEGRLPLESETPPIEFKPGAAYLALASGVKVIPVYTNGAYFSKQRAKVVIGKPIDPTLFDDRSRTDKENIERLTEAMRAKIIELREVTDEPKQ
ncbi:MAG: 1-acyl-sn-glycerol-3-phosphate acyltransferase [Clostridia bacterium]|nr:1-acyl-sn-glycerol-3-phosphate acyltransferase [Clostridia bacterium]